MLESNIVCFAVLNLSPPDPYVTG